MSWAVGDADTPVQEAARVARAERDLRDKLLREVAKLYLRRQGDLAARRQLMSADPERWTQELQDILDRLIWWHRRQLPPHLAPRLPPLDPVVREMRKRDAAHA